MFDIKRKTIEWGGKTLTLETGRMARQADGAVLATYGETMVLATAVFAKSAKPGQDFFPLTVNYQEKFYAAGKIPGSFPRRGGAPAPHATPNPRHRHPPKRPPRGARCEHAGRRFGRPGDLRRPVHGPDRRGARRPGQWRVRPQPDAR